MTNACDETRSKRSVVVVNADDRLLLLLIERRQYDKEFLIVY